MEDLMLFCELYLMQIWLQDVRSGRLEQQAHFIWLEETLANLLRLYQDWAGDWNLVLGSKGVLFVWSWHGTIQLLFEDLYKG